MVEGQDKFISKDKINQMRQLFRWKANLAFATSWLFLLLVLLCSGLLVYFIYESLSPDRAKRIKDIIASTPEFDNELNRLNEIQSELLNEKARIESEIKRFFQNNPEYWLHSNQQSQTVLGDIYMISIDGLQGIGASSLGILEAENEGSWKKVDLDCSNIEEKGLKALCSNFVPLSVGTSLDKKYAVSAKAIAYKGFEQDSDWQVKAIKTDESTTRSNPSQESANEQKYFGMNWFEEGEGAILYGAHPPVLKTLDGGSSWEKVQLDEDIFQPAGPLIGDKKFPLTNHILIYGMNGELLAYDRTNDCFIYPKHDEDYPFAAKRNSRHDFYIYEAVSVSPNIGKNRIMLAARSLGVLLVDLTQVGQKGQANPASKCADQVLSVKVASTNQPFEDGEVRKIVNLNRKPFAYVAIGSMSKFKVSNDGGENWVEKKLSGGKNQYILKQLGNLESGEYTVFDIRDFGKSGYILSDFGIVRYSTEWKGENKSAELIVDFVQPLAGVILYSYVPSGLDAEVKSAVGVNSAVLERHDLSQIRKSVLVDSFTSAQWEALKNDKALMSQLAPIISVALKEYDDELLSISERIAGIAKSISDTESKRLSKIVDIDANPTVLFGISNLTNSFIAFLSILIIRGFISVFYYNVKLFHFYRARSDALKIFHSTGAPIDKVIPLLSPDIHDFKESKLFDSELLKAIRSLGGRGA